MSRPNVICLLDELVLSSPIRAYRNTQDTGNIHNLFALDKNKITCILCIMILLPFTHKIEQKEFNELINMLSQRLPAEKLLRVHMGGQLHELQLAWKKIAGEPLATHSLPTFFRQNTLTITADNNIFAQQLQLYSEKLRIQINKTMSLNIQKVSVRTGQINWAKVKTEDIMSQPEKMADNLKTSPLFDLIEGLEKL